MSPLAASLHHAPVGSSVSPYLFVSLSVSIFSSHSSSASSGFSLLFLIFCFSSRSCFSSLFVSYSPFFSYSSLVIFSPFLFVFLVMPFTFPSDLLASFFCCFNFLFSFLLFVRLLFVISCRSYSFVSFPCLSSPLPFRLLFSFFPTF